MPRGRLLTGSGAGKTASNRLGAPRPKGSKKRLKINQEWLQECGTVGQSILARRACRIKPTPKRIQSQRPRLSKAVAQFNHGKPPVVPLAIQRVLGKPAPRSGRPSIPAPQPSQNANAATIDSAATSGARRLDAIGTRRLDEMIPHLTTGQLMDMVRQLGPNLSPESLQLRSALGKRRLDQIGAQRKASLKGPPRKRPRTNIVNNFFTNPNAPATARPPPQRDMGSGPDGSDGGNDDDDGDDVLRQWMMANQPFSGEEPGGLALEEEEDPFHGDAPFLLPGWRGDEPAFADPRPPAFNPDFVGSIQSDPSTPRIPSWSQSIADGLAGVRDSLVTRGRAAFDRNMQSPESVWSAINQVADAFLPDDSALVIPDDVPLDQGLDQAIIVPQMDVERPPSTPSGSSASTMDFVTPPPSVMRGIPPPPNMLDEWGPGDSSFFGDGSSPQSAGFPRFDFPPWDGTPRSLIREMTKPRPLGPPPTPSGEPPSWARADAWGDSPPVASRTKSRKPKATPPPARQGDFRRVNTKPSGVRKPEKPDQSSTTRGVPQQILNEMPPTWTTPRRQGGLPTFFDSPQFPR
jgi:hypothetical protein